jgi:DNA-3-methyladenine glycosylase I
MKQSCDWPANDPLMIEYHDTEWGVPLHDDRKLFEFLILDAFQAGLNWSIILKKRENFRRVFADFDYRKIAKFGNRDINRLLKDKGIIRNRLKVEAAAKNARAYLEVIEQFGSFDKYIWQFVGGRPVVHEWKTLKQIPSRSDESDAMSKDLKARGFSFVGSTICYAFMQAAGLVNDHLVHCFRYREVGQR